MEIIGRIAGIPFLVFFIIYLNVTRRDIHTAGNAMHTTIFQYNILPFVMGLTLLITGKVILLLICPMLWYSAPRYGHILRIAYPLAFGWYIGKHVFQYTFHATTFYPYLGAILGAILIYIACRFIVQFVSPKH